MATVDVSTGGESTAVTYALDDGVLPGWGAPTFRDEFDGPSLDRSRWNVRDATSNSNEQSYLRAANVAVVDSCLAITVRREAAGGKAYTSGYVDSIGKFSQRYGLFRVRAKLNTPVGSSRGIWPAPLWLRGDSTPMEVDLVESWGVGAGGALNGYKPGNASGSIHQDTAGGGAKVSGWCTPATVDLSRDFHVWECEWSPTMVALRMDGVEFARATPSSAPWAFTPTWAGSPANLRLNVQVSKDTAYYGGPDTSTALPSTLLIDWVRVYAYKG